MGTQGLVLGRDKWQPTCLRMFKVFTFDREAIVVIGPLNLVLHVLGFTHTLDHKLFTVLELYFIFSFLVNDNKRTQVNLFL